MRLVTLNTHSLVEPEYEEKLQIFVQAIEKYQPDILALQEVNQSIISPNMPRYVLGRYIEVKGNNISIKQDNHAFQIVKRLEKKGIMYYWTWIPVHVGYEKYDEGLAVLSREPIRRAEGFFLSKGREYRHYKTRKALLVETQLGLNICCVHMGWWGDEEEPYQNQWGRLEEKISNYNQIFIMGDCNVRSDVRGEGYDWIRGRGWKDTYCMAKEKDSGITVPGKIDGWRGEKEIEKGIRIDYIWCKENMPIECSKIVFNGINEKVVSDHYGIMVDLLV